MRRPGQDRGGTRRIPALRVGGARRILPVLALFVAFLAVAGSASAAKGPANCGGKPGSPDNAALLQYCPKGPKSGSGAAVPGQPASTTRPPGSGGQQANGEASHRAASTDKPSLPLTSYPSSGGVNVLLLILALLAVGGGVAYGARRWRRSRPQPSR